MISIQSITLATTNTEEMVAFYNAVLDTNLQPIEEAPPGFYKGLLAEHNLIVCPNSIAEVVAEQNRQQFCFVVNDIEAVFTTAMSNGGREIDGGLLRSEKEIRGYLYDPDGNSIELMQVLS